MDVGMDVGIRTLRDIELGTDLFIVPLSPPQGRTLHRSRKFMWCLEKPQ